MFLVYNHTDSACNYAYLVLEWPPWKLIITVAVGITTVILIIWVLCPYFWHSNYIWVALLALPPFTDSQYFFCWEQGVLWLDEVEIPSFKHIQSKKVYWSKQIIPWICDWGEVLREQPLMALAWDPEDHCYYCSNADYNVVTLP